MAPNKMMGKGGDMSQDKALIKKAFKQHDMQEHKGGKGTALHLKNGGKAKLNVSKNPGLAKLPTQVRNKMGYMNAGGKVKKYAGGGEASEEISGYGNQEKAVEEKTTPSAATRSMKGASSEGGSEAVSEKKPEFSSFKEAYAYYKNPKNGGEGTTFDYNGKKILVKDKATPTESAKPASGPSSYAEIEKNAPSGTSDAAMRAIRANAKNESNKMADLEKGTSRGQKSSVAAPKITENKSSRKPFAPGAVDNSYSGSRFASGGMVKARQTVKSLGKAC